MKTHKTLLIRNLRGNWSMRLLYEFFMRNKEQMSFGYLDTSHMEYFPPFRHAPLLINSKIREKIISAIFFKNPLPDTLRKLILSDSKLHKTSKLSLYDIRVVFELLKQNNSARLQNYCKNNVPYGKFIHTTLIAKYGVKHFTIPKLQYLNNLILFCRFMQSYRTMELLLSKNFYTCVTLINGRDAAGVGVQLACNLKGVSIVCLENGLTTKSHPSFSQWEGNMHHWNVRENAIRNTFNSYSMNFSLNDAEQLLISKYGTASKFWTKDPNDNFLQLLAPKSFVTFFTTSEKETTTCPSGTKYLTPSNQFDQFDQTESLIKVYNATKELGLHLVLRLHPNFSNNDIANNEFKYFKNLTKSWENTTLIPNYDAANSYKIAELAVANFSFRSTISVELSLLGINCFHTAMNAWSFSCLDKVKIGHDEILDSIKSSIEKVSKMSNNDVYVFSCYMSNHGSKFLSLEFVIDSHSGFQTFVYGNRIDIPRFNFYRIRN
jgi:hypothetical protein